MKVKCPHCEKEFHSTMLAMVPAEQTLAIEIFKNPDHHGEFFDADSIGAVLSSTVKALQATAKSLGSTVAVFISGATFSEGKARFDLVIAEKSKRQKGRK